MSRDDIIRMARDAGFKASVGKTDKDGKYHPDVNALSRDVPVEWLERFAALVAAAEREALRPRLEQCEALARSVMTNKMGCDCKRHGFYASSVDDICPLCAERIRSKGRA